jgi:mono/diheme cytochrome c family protein
MRRCWMAVVLASWLAVGRIELWAEPPSSAERGERVLTARSLLKPAWKAESYRNVGKLWGEAAPDPATQPEAYAEAFRQRYGLNAAPYPNDGLPMGLKRGAYPDGTRGGIQIDCLMCHGGSIGGKSYIGLGNTQIDARRLLDELTHADGRLLPPTTFVVNSSRGTVNAGMFSAVLLSLRNTDLSRRLFPINLGATLPELDTPPWWNLARKKTMYYDGRTPADSVRTNMQFLLGEKSLEDLKALEPDFRDLQAFLRSLKAPKYPFPMDVAHAASGQRVFEKTCARCHGTYGESGEYPSKIVALDVIGTDRARAVGLSDKLVAHYNATWLGEPHPANPRMTGYQAPPLDGIWASAPYLHNGSVPTLHHLLKSSSRPARFKRPPSTDFSHYDRVHVGWTYEVVESPNSLTREERPFYFDTARYGLGNGGHDFGDKLSEDDRMSVIEYLKTL